MHVKHDTVSLHALMLSCKLTCSPSMTTCMYMYACCHADEVMGSLPDTIFFVLATTSTRWTRGD
jgi:hypothetical protein